MVPVKDVETIHNLKKENTHLEKKVAGLSTELKAVSNQLQRVTDETQGRGRGRKRLSDISDRQKVHIKRQRTVSCTALKWMEDEGYTPVRVLALNPSKEIETINLHTTANIEHAIRENITDEEENVLRMMLFVKDRFCVSGSAYHEMAQACKQMPRHYKLKEKITELNSLWSIQPTPNGILGVQQSLEPMLI